MNRLTIAIIATDSNTEKMTYALNSIISQNIKDLAINIYIGINIHSDVYIESILEIVNAYESQFDFKCDFLKNNSELETFWNNATSYAIQNRSDFFTFILNGNAFYEPDSLSKVFHAIDKSNEHYHCYISNTVLYDANNNYIGQTDITESIANPTSIEQAFKIDQNLCGIYTLKDGHISNNSIKLLPNNYLIRHMDKGNSDTAKAFENCKTTEKYNFTEYNILYNYFKLSRRKKRKYQKKIENQLNAKKISNPTEKAIASSLCFDIHNIYINNLINNKTALKTVIANTRIKVVFYVHEYNKWKSLESVYIAMSDDNRFDPVLVYVQGCHTNSSSSENDEIANYHNSGFYPILSEEYFLENERPDIAIFVIPYSHVNATCTVDNVSKIVSRIIYIPYGFTLESEIPELIRLRYKLAMMALAWRVVCDDAYNVILGEKYSWSNNKNFVAWGNPRSDMIKQLPLSNDKEYISNINQKACGRPIILWNTHHSISEKKDSFSTWICYGEIILNFIKQREDAFFIWRPHPYFWGALKKYYGEQKYLNIIEQINNTHNLLIDEYKSYSAVFSVSDVFLSDASSLVKEFLFTGKPIILTSLDDKQIINIELKKCLYIPSNFSEIKHAIDNLLSNKDPKLHTRLKYIQKNSSKGNKTIGKQITKKIYSDYKKELKNLIL